VLDVKNLTKHYPGPQGPGSEGQVKRVLENVSFTIDRADRIALVGVNGAGKSTLMRMLAGLEKPTAGEIRVGHNVLSDYFAQDQYKVLDGSARMLEDITGANPRVDTVTLRNLLGCFMFTGDDVFKTLGVLSGGERNRYALARMLVSPANFLLLDEPTNHLDMRAKDVLLEAIHGFTGTVLFVSHDRYFIDGLATRVFEVEDRRVHIYPGNYEDYLFRKNGGLSASVEQAARLFRTDTATGAKIDAATGMLKAVAQIGKPEEPASAPAETERPTLVITSGDFDAEPWESTHELDGSLAPVTATPKPAAKRLNPIKLKQMEDRVAAIEDELSDLDARIVQAEQQQAVFSTAEAARAVAAELETLREQHATRTAEWEELASQLEEQTTA
jgi:ATP-binding cassette subfamily F protein 3